MSIFPVPARLFVSVAAVFALSACAQMDMHRGGHDQATHAGHAGHAGHGANMEAPAAAPVALAARTVVDVTPQESAHVLGDMQNLLRSVGEINGALAARDWATVERIASSLRPEKTMGSQEPAAVSFHAKLPAGWSSFGAPMHQGFARIADEARGGQRVDEVLRTLSQTTRQCVGCHAQFQLRSALR
ncbi:hypothetical protein [uncultured Sphaerotilus sp.]|uniref:hypothetical protein n=1 Tax=uncultured Sphaerotilus sp. TaxID=474984 RepID=UPI0030CA21F2